MAISFIGASYEVESPHITSQTYAFDAGSAANRVLLVFAWGASGITFDSCTYNGVSMSAETQMTSTVSGYKGRLFYLAGPASGTNDIVVYFTGFGFTGLICAAYSGVNQSTPYDAYAEFKGYSATLTTSLTSQTGDLGVIMHPLYVDGTYTVASGTTERLNTHTGYSTYSVAVVDKPGDTSISLGGTRTTAAEYWGPKLNLNAATTGSGKRNLLLGVG